MRAKTIGNLLRLRFPEWSIWSLPLIAHEYGHVVVADLNRLEAGLGEFLLNQRDCIIALVPEYQDLVRIRGLAAGALQVTSTAAPPDQDLIDCRRAYLQVLEEKLAAHKTRVEQDAGDLIDELFVDSFGTYVLGPAYACAAVFTRLNPILPGAPSSHSDHDRAEVIIATLEKINDQDPDANEYGEIISMIREYWTQAVTMSNPPGARGFHPTRTGCESCEASSTVSGSSSRSGRSCCCGIPTPAGARSAITVGMSFSAGPAIGQTLWKQIMCWIATSSVCPMCPRSAMPSTWRGSAGCGRRRTRRRSAGRLAIFACGSSGFAANNRAEEADPGRQRRHRAREVLLERTGENRSAAS